MTQKKGARFMAMVERVGPLECTVLASCRPPPRWPALAAVLFFILLRWTLIFGFWALFLFAVLCSVLRLNPL